MSPSTPLSLTRALGLVLAACAVVLIGVFLRLFGAVTVLSVAFAFPLAVRFALGCAGAFFAYIGILMVAAGEFQAPDARRGTLLRMSGVCGGAGLVALALGLIIVGRPANLAAALLARPDVSVVVDGDQILLSAPSGRDSVSVFGRRVQVMTDYHPAVALDLDDALRLSKLLSRSQNPQLAQASTRLASSTAVR